MTQRGVVLEIAEDGSRSVVDIMEWPEDRLDLNKRRLKREVQRRRYGKLHLMIIQISPECPTLWEQTVEIT